jgi:hypothetical protein
MKVVPVLNQASRQVIWTMEVHLQPFLTAEKESNFTPLYLRERTPVPTEYDADWAPQPA